MQLSRYEQYYIRKLLRCYMARLNYPMFGVTGCKYFQTDLNHLLQQGDSSMFHLTIRDLRALIDLHQSIDTDKSYYLNRAGVEQKILWLIGLKFLTLIDNTSTIIIAESSTDQFNFILSDRVHCGIRYQNELYGMCLQFGANPDLQSYRVLFTLINRSIPFILMVSEQCHTIWVSLRFPGCQYFFESTLSYQQVA